jgi:hypothetical protein
VNSILQQFLNIFNFLNGISLDVTSISSTTINASNLGSNLSLLAISERQKINNLFTSVIDQPAFNSHDHIRLRKYVIDWYTSLRTALTYAQGSSDPYNLDSEALNELIASFGFPYPQRILSNLKKGAFLESIVPLYQKKGTPEVLVKTLQTYFGFSDVILLEWWIVANPDPHNPGQYAFYARSLPVFPRNMRYNQEFISSVPYDVFIENDPLWQLSLQELTDAYRKNSITLPSITPHISLQAGINFTLLDPIWAILTRKYAESYQFFQYTHRLNRDLYLTQFSGNYSILELSLAIIYLFSVPYKLQFFITNPVNHVELLQPYYGSLKVTINGNVHDVNQFTLHMDNNNNVTEVSWDNDIIHITGGDLLVLDFSYDNSPIKFPYYTDYGRFAPLDGIDPNTGLQGDIITTNLGDILKEYSDLTVRPTTKLQREINLAKRYLIFTDDFDRSKPVINILKDAGDTLAQLNPLFKGQLDACINAGTSDNTLESLLLDFEATIDSTMQLTNFPISYGIIGASLGNMVREIVNFFKPFRVRLRDFSTIFEFKDPLADSQLEFDRMFLTIIQNIREVYPALTDEIGHILIRQSMTDFYRNTFDGSPKDEFINQVVQMAFEHLNIQDSIDVHPTYVLRDDFVSREDKFVLSGINPIVNDYYRDEFDTMMKDELIIDIIPIP